MSRLHRDGKSNSERDYVLITAILDLSTSYERQFCALANIVSSEDSRGK